MDRKLERLSPLIRNDFFPVQPFERLRRISKSVVQHKSKLHRSARRQCVTPASQSFLVTFESSGVAENSYLVALGEPQASVAKPLASQQIPTAGRKTIFAGEDIHLPVVSITNDFA